MNVMLFVYVNDDSLSLSLSLSGNLVDLHEASSPNIFGDCLHQLT